MKERDIFTAIKENDIESVKTMIAKDPTLANSVAPKKPVDTKGMSPLQVSLTTGWHKDIADYLLDMGADVNYMEGPEWHVPQAHPLLYDAVSAAIWNSRRYACVDADDPGNNAFEWKHTREEADRAFEFLSRLIRSGADTEIRNSYSEKTIHEFYEKDTEVWSIYEPVLKEFERF